MAHIYIYTIRRAIKNNEVEYIGLIPKLFGDLYDFDERKENIFKKIEYIKKFDKRFNFKYAGDDVDYDVDDDVDYDVDDDVGKENFFKRLLNNPTNYIHQSKSRNYIHENDIQEIIKLNLESYNRIKKYINYDKFIEHLFRGHDDMEYGLYFSLKYANDDQDFHSKLEELKETKDKRIIYYTRLDTLLNHLEKLHKTHNFSNETKLLYLNKNWDYGKINVKLQSILLERNPDGTINKDKFTTDIKDYTRAFTGKQELENEELICQIPLTIDLFNFDLLNYSKNIFKQKYLHYKNKYIQLKKILKKNNFLL